MSARVRARLFAVVLVSLAVGPLASSARAAPSANEAALQVALRATGDYRGTVDGVLGAATRAALLGFQARSGLAPDGVIGAATRQALGHRGKPAWNSRALGPGMQGWDVAILQFKLARMGFPAGNVDGGFGPHLTRALRRFQAWTGLPADGIAGPATRARLAAPAPASPLRFYRPIGGSVTDRFGPRGARFHSGVDFPAASGDLVRAAGRGRVTSAGWDPGGYGNLVVVEHRLGVTSWYAHLSSIAVRDGQSVTGGDIVGRVGATGTATGPHLHFELRLRGAVVDPLPAFL